MKSELPKITVITPSFNQGQFIEETITSVLDQKYPNLEYIVMDGGSTDNTVEILKKYRDKLSYVSQKDNGQTDALNKGVKKSTGDILMYLNSDDVMVPGTLNKVGHYFTNKPETKWLTGDYIIIDGQGKEIQKYVVAYKKILRFFPYFSILAIANFVIQPSTFWRRELHDELGFFDEKLDLCMDYDFWLRVINKHQLHVLPDKFSKFRIHSVSKGRTQFIKQFAQEHQVLLRYTNNPLLIGLHKFHASLIIGAYNLIK